MPGKRSSAKQVREKAFGKAEQYKAKDRAKQRRRLNGPDQRGTRMHSKRVGVQCGANKGGGGKCKLAAGWGTPHPGTGRCKLHGGASPSHVKSAAKGELRNLLGKELEMNPFEAIMWCIRIRAGEVQWLSEQMEDLDKNAWTEKTLVGEQFHLYAKERQAGMKDLVHFSQIAISMGIAERYVRLAEVYGATIAKLIQGILEELNLSEEQKALAPRVIRRQLLLIQGDSVPPIDEEDVVDGSAKRKQLEPATRVAA